VVPQVSLPIVPSLRERNKAKRRHAIIDAALELLRTIPLSGLSVEQIGAVAEVSPATVYNLVGTRDQLLVACVDRLVEGLEDALLSIDLTSDPIAAAFLVVEISSEAFIADGAAFRQILRVLNVLASEGTDLAVDPGQFEIAAMRAAHEKGILRDDVDPAATGRQISLSYNGALFAWSAGLLTDDGFRAAARHGLWSALAGSVTANYREGFLDQLRRAGADLMRAGFGIAEK
jgi:AcrR family transcriptional regulator